MESSRLTKPLEQEPSYLEASSGEPYHSHLLCPKCGVSFTARIKRPFLVKLVFRKFESRRYVCSVCKRVYYIASREM